MIRYVCGFMFNNLKSSVVLIRKKRPEWQNGMLNGVGGKVNDYDDDDIGAMIREFREETGVHYENWKHFVTITDRKEFEVVFFAAADTEAFDKAYTATDEIIVKSIITGRGDISFAIDASCVFNLNWLIPLALDEKVIKPVTIIYTENGLSIGNGPFTA